MPNRSRLSEASNRSFLFFHFDFVLSSSSARYLQNLIVSKNARNSRAARQCDLLIVRSFLDCFVSFSTSSVRPVYLRVPWNGKPSTNLEKEVKTAVEICYGSISTRLVSTSKRMLPVACKDVLPPTQKSSVIYGYRCHCDSRYVGRTSQRLQDRIKQHFPQCLRQQLTCPRRSQPHRLCKRTDTKPDCDSAIGQHLFR